MRDLAYLVRIKDIAPIPAAEAIEVATVRGWKVVVKKNEFKVGDLAIYCEVDSWVPTDIAPFLSKNKEPAKYNEIAGERLRTVTLRGQLSQGLLLPVSVLAQKGYLVESTADEGHVVTEVLGIQKYEPPVPANMTGLVKGAFPSCFPKTDEERIQNLVDVWPDLCQLTYEVTEKLEGSSMSCGKVNGEFIVCSRNLNLKETAENSLWAMARKYEIEAQMVNMDNLIIQGELVGMGVQGNHYGFRNVDFYVFAIYDIAKGEFVSPEERQEFCIRFGLKHVPVVSSAMAFTTTSVEEMLAMANGMSQVNPAKLREGLVFKQTNGQVHFKVVSNQYLLKTKT